MGKVERVEKGVEYNVKLTEKEAEIIAAILDNVDMSFGCGLEVEKLLESLLDEGVDREQVEVDTDGPYILIDRRE